VTNAQSPRARIHWADLAISIPLDTSPYQIVDTMHLNKVDLVFRMLKLNQAYVTDSGQLVGVISRSSLRRFVANRVSCCVQPMLVLWLSF
jgi:hypothetical protein